MNYRLQCVLTCPANRRSIHGRVPFLWYSNSSYSRTKKIHWKVLPGIKQVPIPKTHVHCRILAFNCFDYCCFPARYTIIWCEGVPPYTFRLFFFVCCIRNCITNILGKVIMYCSLHTWTYLGVRILGVSIPLSGFFMLVYILPHAIRFVGV